MQRRRHRRRGAHPYPDGRADDADDQVVMLPLIGRVFARPGQPDFIHPARDLNTRDAGGMMFFSLSGQVRHRQAAGLAQRGAPMSQFLVVPGALDHLVLVRRQNKPGAVAQTSAAGS